MAERTFSQKIAYNTIFQIIGKIITTVLSLILIAYLTRYLGVFGFGVYTTVFVYLSFFGVIADFGFFNILVREISKKPEDEQAIANNLLTFRAFFALSVYLIGILVAYFLPYSATIKTGIILISLATFFGTQNSSLVGIFQARHKMDRAVISDICGRALILILSIWLIKKNASIEMIFIAAIFGNLSNLLISWLLVLPYVKLRPAFNFSLWKKIFFEAWPLGVAAIFGIIYFKIDSIFLSLFRGSMDVGIYGAPYKILENLLLVPAIFMGNVFPVLAHYIKEKDARLNSAVQKAFDFLNIAGIGMLFFGLVLSQKIIHFVAGEQFVTVSTLTFAHHAITAPLLFQILLFAMAVSFISNTFAPIIIAANRQKSLVKPTILATIINVSLNLLLIPRFGYLAAAATTVITETFILIYQWILVKKTLNISLQIHNFVKIIISALVMAIILYLLRELNLIILIMLGLVIYVFMLFLFKVITRSQIASLVSGENT